MKSIVKTVGSFMYLDQSAGQVIEAEVLSLVKSTAFVESLIAQGKLRQFATQIPNSATQEALNEFVKASENERLAVASFMSTFGLDDFGNKLEGFEPEVEAPVEETPEVETPVEETPEVEVETPVEETPEVEEKPVVERNKRNYNKK